MRKVKSQEVRRAELVEATIAEIGAAGNLDVTVGQIARRAGVSSALAHHYFGGKDQILWAAMHHILREYGQEVRAELGKATTPRARIDAIVIASFSPACFAPASVSTWMILYAHAPRNAGTLRLLQLYQRRLRSNLLHELRQVSDRPEADADAIAALIDGVYLRAALAKGMAADEALHLVKQQVDRMIGV